MANELKTRIVLEGEKEYARAMSDAARQMKALNAEEKLAQAQFRATGNAEAHAAEQSRILREQIALQQQAVQAAEKAVAALTQQGVQPNDAAMTKWRTKLANARTALVQLQARLDSVEDDLREDTRGFESAGDAARDYGDDLRKIGGTINTQAAVDSIGKITGAIEGTLRTAARATKAVVGIATEAGQWADSIKTTADQMGIDPETLQSWTYAAAFIDTDMTDISKSWQDIGKKLLEGNNDFAVGLDNMGIATRDAAGNLRSTEAIFWDAVDYLHGIDDESLRAAKATELFGNDWRKINPLIMAGSKAFQDLAAEGREVAVVSNENVDKLGGMQDSFDGLQMRVTKLKMDTVAAMADNFKGVADALSIAVTALDEFIQSEAGQQALADLGGALESIITQFTEVDENGENGFQKLVNKAAEAIGGLTEGLKWISTHSGSVVTALTIIGGVLGALKVAQGVLTFLQLMQSANWIGGGNGGNGGGGGGLGGLFSRLFKGGQPTGTPTTAPAPVGGNPFGQLAGPLAAAVIGMGVANVNNALGTIDRLDGEAEAIRDVADATGQAKDEYADLIKIGTGALESKIIGNGLFGPIWGENHTAEREALAAFQAAGLEGVLSPATYAELMAADASGPSNRALVQKVTEELAAAVPEIKQAGEDTVNGYAEGMEAAMPAVNDAANNMAGGPINVIRQVLDMHSPSKVMEGLGQMAGMGFAQGLLSSSGAVAAAAAALGAIASRIPVGGAAGAGAFAAGAMAGASFSSSFYIDKYVQNTGEDARALAARVQDVNGWTRAGFGHRV